MIIGYARVSTKEQNIQLQIDALQKIGVEQIFEEKKSALKSRPELDKLMDFCRSGDTVVVWKMDRIARSLRHIIEIVEVLKSKDVNFISITEKIDTNSSLGQFFFHITGAFAELERNLTVERTLAGLQVAREKGRIGGRPKGLTRDALKKAKEIKNIYLDKNNNLSIDEICKMFQIGSKATLYRYLKLLDVPIQRKKGRK